MATTSRLTRRELLHGAAQVGAAAWAFHFAPASALGAEGQPPPSDTVLLGGIGVGRQGRGILGAGRGSKVIAVADVYRQHLYDVAKSRGGCDTYEDYRKMLERHDLDAVTVGTPDHWHVPCCLHAVEAGKDVYCEKPLSLTIAEGRVLVKAVRRYARVFQTGSQQRSSFHCRHGCELVRNARAGRIHTVHGNCYPSPWYPEGLAEEPVPEGLDWEMWLGPAPVYPYNINIQRPRAKPGWISFLPFSGGEMTGWGSHGLDIIQWGLGADETGPVEVWADSVDLRSQVHYRYASGVMVHLDRGPAGGGVFVGDEGEIMVTRGAFSCKPKEIGEAPITASDERLYFSNHHGGNWLECIRTRRRPICDVEIGHRSCTVCHLGNIARWLAPRKLRWDPDKEVFPDDAEANRYLERPRREPYRL